jgi:hypothetical protein
MGMASHVAGRRAALGSHKRHVPLVAATGGLVQGPGLSAAPCVPPTRRMVPETSKRFFPEVIRPGGLARGLLMSASCPCCSAC